MKQIEPTEIVGKTVAGFSLSCCDESAIVAFTDGTFIHLKARYAYESCELESKPLDLLDFGDKQLESLGIATEASLKAQREENRRRWDAENAERERQQYEKLKAKFGD